ncbi:MAG TPA: hypothetical protein VIV12_19855 [Streptosporangiaceae bacterium]
MTCEPDAATVALEQLAAALEPGEFATTLVTRAGRVPSLWVLCRRSGAAQEARAQDGWYWWEWAEAIAPADDPLAAAHKITAALRDAPHREPTRGR